MAQLVTLARGAGWTGNNIPIAGAVAMAESSGRTDVVNFLGCVGPWQVYQKVHAKAHPEWTTEWLKNPVNNAHAAYTIWQGQGWQGWSTYTNGAYKKYMASATAAAASGVNADITIGGKKIDPLAPFKPGTYLPGAADVGIPGAQTLEDLNDIAGKLSDPHLWIRIAYILLGVILVLIALTRMSGVQKVAKVAVNAMPEGRAATVISKAVK